MDLASSQKSYLYQISNELTLIKTDEIHPDKIFSGGIMHMCSDHDLVHQCVLSDLSSKFISWDKMSKRNRLSQRIWLCRLIPKGVLGNQLSFCKQPMTAQVNHSFEMRQSHFQPTALKISRDLAGESCFWFMLFSFGLFAFVLIPDDLFFWQQWQQVYLLYGFPSWVVYIIYF